jgi:hypothetical protein
MLYHKTINSFFVSIVRIKYQNDKYIKCHLRYFNKGSNQLIAEERNVKITKSAMKHWEVYVS